MSEEAVVESTVAAGSSVTFGLSVDQTFELTTTDGTTGTISLDGPFGSPMRWSFGPARQNNWKPVSKGLSGALTLTCTAGSVSYKLGNSVFVTATTDAVTGQSSILFNGDTTPMISAGWAAGLSPTGYDQSAEIEQYINDGGGIAGLPDLGAGDFILGSPIILRPPTYTNMPQAEYWWQGGVISRSLSFRGLGPGKTVLRDVRTNTTVPVIQFAQTNANYGTMQNTRIGGFSLFRCDTNGTHVAQGSEAGQGIWLSKTAANSLGVTHDGIIEDVQISGFTDAFSVDDCTQLKFSRVLIPVAGSSGIRMGYNLDNLTLDNVYGGWSLAGAFYNNFWLLVTGWDAPNKSFNAGSSNMVLLNQTYIRGIGGMLFVNGTTDTQFTLSGVAIERCRQFIRVAGSATPKITVRDWQISQSDYNDFCDYPKIQIEATPIPYISLSGGRSAVTTKASTVVVAGEATIEWNNNSIVAASGFFVSALSAIAAAGTGYTAGDTLTVVGGTGTAATINVTTVDGGGGVTAATISSVGSYSVSPTIAPATVTGGTGSSATFTLAVTALGNLTSTKAYCVASRTIPMKSTESHFSLKMGNYDYDTLAGTPGHYSPIAKQSGDEITKQSFADTSGTVTLSKLEADFYYFANISNNTTFDVSTTDGVGIGDTLKILVKQKAGVGSKTIAFTSARMKANASNDAGGSAAASTRAFYEFRCISATATGGVVWQQVSPAAVWY